MGSKVEEHDVKRFSEQNELRMCSDETGAFCLEGVPLTLSFKQK